MIRLIKTFLFLIITGNLIAQNSNLSGIINNYSTVSAIDTCQAMLTVSDTIGFRKGNSLILIQMRGATVVSPNNSTFGNISNMNQTGRYERAIIDSIASNKVFLRSKILNSYDLTTGAVQIVTFPKYQNATIIGKITPKPWNGAIGGIVALEITGIFTMNAEISVDTAGFRGGGSFIASSNDCNFLFTQNNFSYDANNWRGAPKGEGIAQIVSGKENGKGAQANGGGGGNDHNSGGGGGGNISNGGNGGSNNEPSAAGCQGNHPGVGGKKISETTSRVFMGGGGGAGHTNNILKSDGGRGGGILFLLASTVNGSNPTLTAKGGNAQLAPGDGAGGGGAGGTIVCSITNAPTTLIIDVAGGNGGNTGSIGAARCNGPGGGGSGGRTITNLNLSVSLGGNAGIVQFSTENCVGSNNGAGIGQNSVTEVFESIPEGQNVIGYPIITQNPVSQSVCTDETFSFSCQCGLNNPNYQWQYNTGNGWVNIPTNSGFSGINTTNLNFLASNLTQNGFKFRCKIEKLPCFSLTTQEAILIVNQGATCDFSYTSSLNTFTFTNESQNANSYFWDFGDGFSSTLNNPTHTYATDGNYTIILYAIADCDTAILEQNISLFPAPIAGINYTGDLIGCGPVTITYSTAIIGDADNFTWFFPNGNPSTSQDSFVTVTYSETGNYVVTLQASNSQGSNIVSIPINIEVYETPVANFEFDAAIGGLVQFSDLSIGAGSINWFFGDNTSSQLENPSHQYAENGTYIVTQQVTNPCGAAVLQQFVNVIVVGTVVVEDEKYLLAYPNPMDDFLVVESNWEGEGVFNLYDISGKKVISIAKNGLNTQQVDVSSLVAGVYVLELKMDNKRFFIKIVK
jgi:PKD repeat protein